MTLIGQFPRFRQARKALSVLRDRESWSCADISAYQLDCINRTWQHAIENVPYYRRLRNQLTLPSTFATIDEYKAQVPVLSKANVRDLPKELLSEQHLPGSWQRTGGSTGVPTKVFRSHKAHRQGLTARYRALQQWGVDFLDPHAMLWGHAGSFAPGLKGQLTRWKRPLEDWLRGRCRLSAYRLGEDDIREYLSQMDAHGPVWMYGYSSAVYLLALTAARLKVKVPSLKLSVLTAEPVFKPMVAEVEEAFASPAITEYGSVETGVMATESKDRTLRVRDDMVLLETLPREDGLYDIAVTVLNNESFPLLRFEVGDLTRKPIETPEVGFSILSNVAGRNNDMLQSRSGRLVHALAVKHVLEQCQGVSRFKAQQMLDGQLHVTIEQSTKGTTIDVSHATSQLADLLEGFEVSFEFVDQIPGNTAGKHRWVASDLVEAHS